MAEPTGAEKAQEILDNSPETEELDQSTETTDDQSEGKKDGENSEKADEGEKLYAGTFKTPEMLEKSVNELAGTLQMSRLEQRTLRSAIAEAKESNDFSEVEEIYKEMQAKHTKSKQAEAPGKDGAEDRTVVEQKEYVPLSDEQRINYLRGQVKEDLMKDPIMARFREKGIDFPTAEVGTDAWDAQMLELADTSPGLHNLLDKRLTAIAQEHVRWLQNYESSASGAKGARSTAEDSGRKYLNEVNTELSLGLTPDAMAEIISKSLKHEDSYKMESGVQTARKDAVEAYFKKHELYGMVKSLQEKARADGALGQGKALLKMKDEAMQTAGKSKLSSEANRRGKDAPDFSSHKTIGTTTHEQRERRINEILSNSKDVE
jgi:hypothetical protein